MKMRDSKAKFISFLGITTAIIYLFWRLFFTLPFEHGPTAMFWGIILFIAELIGIISGIEQLLTSKTGKEPEMPTPPKEWYPDVDVFIATHNEPVDLLYKTINACLYMEYPDKDKVHIYLCDDNERPEMETLANKMNIGYLGVKGNKDAKAGNLNYALSKTQSPLVVTFDADMIPRRTFLMHTVPYFYLPIERQDEDLKIGFIQTPQSFYNADLFQYNLYSEETVPNEQDFFFKHVNVVRNRANATIYVGSNTVIARAALEEVGGIATGLITEDFATGINIQKKGYTCIATATPEAHGLSPDELKSLISQRERWARGCIQSLRKQHIIFSRHLSLAQKVSYLSSLLYWYFPLCRMIYVLSPILYSLFNIQLVSYKFEEMLWIFGPYFLLYNYALSQSSNHVRNARLSNIYDTIMFPYLLVPVLLETVGIKKKKFVITKKERSYSDKKNYKYIFPHVSLMLVSLVAIIKTTHTMIITDSSYYLVMIIWLVINFYALLMATAFSFKREMYRSSERLKAELPIELEIGHKTVKARTIDISDHGLSVYLDFPEYIKDEVVHMVCYNDWYKAEGLLSIVHVMKYQEEYKYSFKLKNIDEANKSQYMQLVYDRLHGLPTRIEKGASVFNELFNNIHYRFNKKLLSSRRLPRLEMNAALLTDKGQRVILKDFNYEYMLVSGKKLELQKEITLLVDNHLQLQGEQVQKGHIDADSVLYKIKQPEVLAQNPVFCGLLIEWSKSYQLANQKKEKSNKAHNYELNEWEYIWKGEY